MNYLMQRISQAKKMFRDDSLFRNAIFLMSSAAVMSVLGFGFWVFVAHLYAPADIGVASALIAVTLLISNLSLLGLNSGLVRFLPDSKNQSADINAAIITAGSVAILVSAVYLSLSHRPTSSLSFIANSNWGAPLFMVLMAAVAVNSLTDSVFIANRRAAFHTAAYAVFGIVRLLLPLFLVRFTSMGIFAAYIAAVIISLTVSLAFMYFYFDYHFLTAPNWVLLRRSKKYASSNYVAVILAGLPSQIMPLLIISQLGKAEAAYFSMAWMMANLLYVIPSSITQSMLAESSNSIKRRGAHARSARRLLAIILVPIVAFAILMAPFVLRIFGANYAAGSTTVFQILALATFFIAINNIREATLNIEHRSSRIVLVQLANAAVSVGSAKYLLHFGLAGAALSMLVGYMASSAVHGILFAWNRSDDHTGTSKTPSHNFVESKTNMAQLIANYGISDFEYKVISRGATSLTTLMYHDDTVQVLKLYHDQKQTEAIIKDELQFVLYLRSHQLAVPRPVANMAGNLLSVTTRKTGSLPFVLMEFEAGEHPRSYNLQLIDEMGSTQAKIHLAGLNYARQLRASGVRLKSGRAKHYLPILNIAPKGYSHFDFDKTNILVKNDRITSVLDFEGMRYDALVSCTFFTVSDIFKTTGNIELVKQYMAAYEAVRPLQFIERFILTMALVIRFKKFGFWRTGLADMPN